MNFDMEDIFGTNGRIGDHIPGFEYRDEQRAMAEFIAEILIEGEHGLVEAGTGTGKTLAYLVPVALHAIEQGKRVIITTETKSLQKQLLEKDLPIVHAVIDAMTGMDLSYTLCLGSSNYPCRSRFESALQKGKIGEKDLKRVQQIIVLFNDRRPFSRFDVSIPEYLWREFNREADACLSYRCAYREQCPYQMTRRSWGESTILVMNHYLLFSHIATDRTYLPDCEIIVFDEAHSLEDIASTQLGFSICLNDLKAFIHEFDAPKKEGFIDGIINTELRDKGRAVLQEITENADTFFKHINNMLGRFKNSQRLVTATNNGDDLADNLKKFMVIMSEAAEFIPETDRQGFDIVRGKLFQYLENLNQFVSFDTESSVFWLERDPDTSYADMRINGQPAEISGMFQKEIVERYETSIMVSATLSVAGDFSYITERLGYTRFKSLVLDSSFDFRSQVILYVAREAGDPLSDGFISQSTGLASEIISFLNGNCLLLFTSYKMLREFKGSLGPLITHSIHSQDDQTAAEAFDAYVRDENAVLMGTHSFWQGIDLPGDLLRGLIMLRLPFSVPDSPPVQARIERIKERGGNPFMVYQVPEAIIKFKQGFGRLIRSRLDYGIIAILDSRIATKSYGKLFMKSIPECRTVYTIDEMITAYRDMFPQKERQQNSLIDSNDEGPDD